MKRQGFTLVEMLVAMALTLFIMVILSQAFITGLDTFSQLKGIGDMEEKLRVFTNNMRNDLTLDHFEAKRRMSDPTFLSAFPRQGFFRIYQKTPSFLEGSDLDQVREDMACLVSYAQQQKWSKQLVHALQSFLSDLGIS